MIKENKGLLIGLGMGMVLAVLSVVFLIKTQSLNVQVKAAKETTKQLKDELQRVQTEKEKLAQENEKAQADAVSILSLNTRLEENIADLNDKLSEATASLNAKKEELETKKAQIDKLNADKAKFQGPEYDKLVKEKQELADEIESLRLDLDKERAIFHYNLGVAYSQAKLYDEAIEAYEKSLSYEPDNAEAYYNLGLLYNDYKYDTDKAKESFNKYLELSPGAEDKEEVKELINKLK